MIKKKSDKIPILSVICLLTSFTFHAGLAEAAATCGTALGIFCPATSDKDLMSAIITITKYLFSLIGIVCIIFIITGGTKYMISAGNEQKIKSAKETLSSAILGLIVALIAYAILEIIHGILNG